MLGMLRSDPLVPVLVRWLLWHWDTASLWDIDIDQDQLANVLRVTNPRVWGGCRVRCCHSSHTYPFTQQSMIMSQAFSFALRLTSLGSRA